MKIQAIISVTKQTGEYEWTTYHHSKTFEMKSTLLDIENWAKSYGKGISIFDVKISTSE